MARYSAGAKSGSSVSGNAPAGSIYASDTTTTPVLREIGIFNTTSTACDVKLIRLTSAGTTSASLTEGKHEPNSPTASGAAFNYHTVAPSVGDDLGYRASLGAAVGAGVIWSFGASGIRVAAAGGPSTANGVGIVAENGTLQQVQFYFVWDEG